MPSITTLIKTVNLRNNLHDVVPRIIWQELFNLYREGEGDLNRLDNLLIDYDNIKEWLDTNLEYHQIIWAFHPHGITTWFSILSYELPQWQWKAMEYDYCYTLKFTSLDTLTIERVNHAL